MIEDDFYATIKFKSGEEVYAKVAASEEDTRTMLLVSNPITIVEVKTRAGVAGYKVEPWLKTTREDLFIINLDDVLTISESSDLEMISIYQRYVQDSAKAKSGRPKITREMGYISTVRDAKDILEKLYKSS
jgi:hypothetical protein|tara:strand:- start:419 stop:811 length:393 start_codon:yes stop_codon:yes gene_type:complete